MNYSFYSIYLSFFLEKIFIILYFIIKNIWWKNAPR